MLKKTYNLLISLIIITFVSTNIAHANDYYSSLFQNQVQHSLYFSVPLHRDKFNNDDAPIRIGFSSDFTHETQIGNPFSFNSRKFRASLVKFEFTGSKQAKFQLAGHNFGGLNRDGLYLGQDGDEDEESSKGASTTQLIALGAIIAVGGFFAFKSDTKSVPGSCSPTPIPGVTNNC